MKQTIRKTVFAVIMLLVIARNACGAPYRIEVKAPGMPEKTMETVAAEAERLMAEAAELIGHQPDGPYIIYIADSKETFRRYAGPGAPEWAIAIYTRGKRAVVMRAESYNGQPSEFMNILKHELIHAALDHMFREHPRSLPRWLNEGLAVYASDAWESPSSWFQRRADMYKALKDGRGFDFGELDSGFPSGRFLAELAYTQSYDFVAFLIDKHGEKNLRILLSNLATGSESDEAFRAAFRQSFDSAVSDWRAHSSRPGAIIWLMHFFAAFDTYIWAAMALLAVIGAVKVFFGLRRGRRKLNVVYHGDYHTEEYDPEDDWDDLDEDWDPDAYGRRPWRPGKHH